MMKLNIVDVGCRLLLISVCLVRGLTSHDHDWLWIGGLFALFLPKSIKHLIRMRAGAQEEKGTWR
jgi:hypothetical protein